MGCGGSKLEDEAAVALCRERSMLLADAIRHRYALADAHAAYVRSLRAVGGALEAFLRGVPALPPASPVLPLPAHRKGDDLPQLTPSPPPAAGFVVHSRSRSNSGSHIHFRPSESGSDDDSPLHSEGASPVHHIRAGGDPVGPTYVNLNYSRNRPAEASVVYEQQPPSSQPVRFGSVNEHPPMAYPYYGQPYPPQSSNFYPYPAYPYMSYGSDLGGGFFGSSLPPPNIEPAAAAAVGPSTAATREARPPPSPPRASSWDFLNPFDSYDSYYDPYASSRSSKSSRELREEEGIPDLEDEQEEIVKEAYGDSKLAVSSSDAANGEYTAKDDNGLKQDAIGSTGQDPYQKTTSLEERSSSEQEVHVVKNSVVTEPEDQNNAMGFTVSRSYHDVNEIAQEIKIQFDRASESADKVAKMLEVGRFLYHRKNSVYKAVSARMICGLSPLSTSKDGDLLVFEEDKAMDCGNLSSTLQQLYNWEKKLLEEVMAEEKMRVLYDRKREQLKHLSERGAEAEKLEAVGTFMRKLSTKIRIAIKVVDTISSKISQLRDGELWPQTIELIQGFSRMWTIMSECHHVQCQAISEAKNLDSIVNGVKLTDVHMDAIKQLEMSMVDLIASFSAWVTAQRSYVKSLNGWLVKGVHYVPEETDDGVPPFSPGRLGAPPIFVICNSWSQSMDMISERDSVDAMQAFAHNVFNIWQQNNFEQRQRLLANRDMDSNLRLMERDEQIMLKHKNKLALISVENGISLPERVLHQGSAVDNLQLSLKQIFEAMETYAASFAKAYETHMNYQGGKIG
ncbi:hypothetical protein Cni_G27703 [Canna indica]|uniref:BZIP transcription factor n=1 Tax=Canna indica TaxID=4628 RepID=A0AAQ3QN70_9LILI|nr:hypothetical protein Cni_G27703 [Canna indica]